LETLVFQEVRALNDALSLGYGLHYWQTSAKLEVDIVLYGERGIRAIEVKRSSRVRDDDLRGLRAFVDDYPMAQAWLVYTGARRFRDRAIEIIPLAEFLAELREYL
jgi:predicted AAA+ superfamily ATPase